MGADRLASTRVAALKKTRRHTPTGSTAAMGPQSGQTSIGGLFSGLTGQTPAPSNEPNGQSSFNFSFGGQSSTPSQSNAQPFGGFNFGGQSSQESSGFKFGGQSSQPSSGFVFGGQNNQAPSITPQTSNFTPKAGSPFFGNQNNQPAESTSQPFSFQPATAQNNNSTSQSSPFGQSSATTFGNPFSFGAKADQTPSFPSATSASNGNLFGGLTSAPSEASSSQPTTPQPAFTNIFGSTQSQANASTSEPQVSKPAGAAPLFGGNVFGTPFGQPKSTASEASVSQATTSQPSTSSNPFAFQPSTSESSTTKPAFGNLFGSQPSTSQTSAGASPPKPAAAQPLFGSGTLFGNNTGTATSTSSDSSTSKPTASTLFGTSSASFPPATAEKKVDTPANTGASSHSFSGFPASSAGTDDTSATLFGASSTDTTKTSTDNNPAPANTTSTSTAPTSSTETSDEKGANSDEMPTTFSGGITYTRAGPGYPATYKSGTVIGHSDVDPMPARGGVDWKSNFTWGDPVAKGAEVTFPFSGSTEVVPTDASAPMLTGTALYNAQANNQRDLINEQVASTLKSASEEGKLAAKFPDLIGAKHADASKNNTSTTKGFVFDPSASAKRDYDTTQNASIFASNAGKPSQPSLFGAASSKTSASSSNPSNAFVFNPDASAKADYDTTQNASLFASNAAKPSQFSFGATNKQQPANPAATYQDASVANKAQPAATSAPRRKSAAIQGSPLKSSVTAEDLVKTTPLAMTPQQYNTLTASQKIVVQTKAFTWMCSQWPINKDIRPVIAHHFDTLNRLHVESGRAAMGPEAFSSFDLTAEQQDESPAKADSTQFTLTGFQPDAEGTPDLRNRPASTPSFFGASANRSNITSTGSEDATPTASNNIFGGSKPFNPSTSFLNTPSASQAPASDNLFSFGGNGTPNLFAQGASAFGGGLSTGAGNKRKLNDAEDAPSTAKKAMSSKNNTTESPKFSTPGNKSQTANLFASVLEKGDAILSASKSGNKTTEELRTPGSSLFNDSLFNGSSFKSNATPADPSREDTRSAGSSPGSVFDTPQPESQQSSSNIFGHLTGQKHDNENESDEDNDDGEGDETVHEGDTTRLMTEEFMREIAKQSGEQDEDQDTPLDTIEEREEEDGEGSEVDSDDDVAETNDDGWRGGSSGSHASSDSAATTTTANSNAATSTGMGTAKRKGPFEQEESEEEDHRSPTKRHKARKANEQHNPPPPRRTTRSMSRATSQDPVSESAPTSRKTRSTSRATSKEPDANATAAFGKGPSLFDRISRDVEGNSERDSNKTGESTPKSIFGFPNTAPNLGESILGKRKDNQQTTYQPGQPIKFASQTPSSNQQPLFNFQPSTPAATENKENAPTTGGFNFNFGGWTPSATFTPAPNSLAPPSAAPSLFTTTPGSSLFPSRATTPAVSAGGQSDNAEGSDGEDKPADPQSDLLGIAAEKQGHETLFETRKSAIYQITDGKWSKKGVGPLLVLRSLADGHKKILMKIAPSGKVLINSRTIEGGNYRVVNKKQAMFVVPNTGNVSVRFGNDGEEQEFVNACLA